MATGFMKQLRITARKHDVICCPVSDPRELELTDAGLLEVEDPETGALMLLDTASSTLRERFKKAAADETQERTALLRKTKTDILSLSTDRPFIDDIRSLFQKRQRRASRG
jgi:uncharacterized protein (DUF58 family)